MQGLAGSSPAPDTNGSGDFTASIVPDWPCSGVPFGTELLAARAGVGVGEPEVLRDAAAAISREGSGIGENPNGVNSGPVGEDRGNTFDELGADGSKRKVRVVGD